MQCIVMTDQIGAIASNGIQPIHLRADLLRFQSLTRNHAVIMGRHTFMCLPNMKPLCDRENYVLTTDPGHLSGVDQYNNLHVYRSVQEIIEHAPADAFVIGGGTIYRQFMFCCDTIYLTKVMTIFDHPSTFFPKLSENWVIDPKFDEDEVEIDQDRLTSQIYQTKLIIYRRHYYAGAK